MRLTEHFTLSELQASTKAAQLRIDNTAPPDVLPRLAKLADLLERVRGHLGVPITVTSGYRCHALNRAVGGVTSSDHTQGMAADIVAPGYGTPYAIAKALAPQVSALGIGQIILEGVRGKQWVHISTRVPDKPANRVITITDRGTQLGIQELP
nr:D-Ala-D-Ala carboxypeptidase family metallohydrolase [uncultured Albidiferax sp.]